METCVTMKNKRASRGSKEIFSCLGNHGLLGRVMWRCALIAVLLLKIGDLSVEAATEDTPEFHTDLVSNSYTEAPETMEENENASSRNPTTATTAEGRPIATSYSSINPALKSSPSSGFVRNVKIYPVYNSVRNKIVLNVSWDQPLNLDDVSSYDFKITSDSNYPECKYSPYSTINRNKTLTSVLLPPLLAAYEVKASCTYIISIISDRSRLGNATVNIRYTLPECVGKKCSCRHLTPQVRDLKVTEISPGRLNVSWAINHSEVRPVANNITNITLGYRVYNLERKYPFTDHMRVSNFNSQKSYWILNDTHHVFIPNKEYQLQVNFYNTHRCRATNLTNFIASAIPVHSNSTLGDVEKPSNGSWEIILVIVVLSLVILFAIYILRRNRLVIKELILNPFSLRFTRRGRHSQDSRNSYVIVPTITKRQQEINLLYVEKEILDGHVDRYEFPRSRITLIREIGEGAFGQVFLAKAFDIRDQPGFTFVAVKTLRERAPPEEMDDFLSEIEILKKVGEHPNIVSLFGCCVLKEPYLMVMEFVPCGDLKHYLLDLRQKWLRKKRSRNDSTPVFSDSSDGTYITPDSPRSHLTSEGRPSVTETEYTILDSEGFPTPTESYNNKVESNLDHTELQNFALQIAKGMEHLEKIPIAHRDLAARNILINEYKTLKISDFGLSRIGPYVNSKTKRLPLRWMAIEAIEDSFYDSKSDVWSFAIVLWEIGTLGAFPYENVMDRMLRNHLISGKRLPRPEICTDELYSLMLRCWSHDPQLRPSFRELVDLLDVKKRRIYVDFNHLNPLYVFPPCESSDDDKKLKTLECPP